jgi:hypothetical protein
MAIDYSIWRENEADRPRYFWEIIDVLDDGCEVNMTGGIADSHDEAYAQVKAAMRNKPWRQARVSR